MNKVRLRLAVLAGAIGLMSCTTLQEVNQPQQFIPQNKPKVVYVTSEEDGEPVVMSVVAPRVSGDSLFGTWDEAAEAVALPLSKVHHVEAMQVDKKRTTVLVVSLTAIAALGTFAILQATGGGGGECHTTGQGVGSEDTC